MHILTFLLALSFSTPALANTTNQLRRARSAVKSSGLTSIPVNCLLFTEEKGHISVREKHGGPCPGDPATAPLVARLRMQDGKVMQEDPATGKLKALPKKRRR